ncbi:pilin [Vreelandella massiliensis]|uniref:pilin n=1 Tax=Vreelandella massiliensis TaxID=1816686 RepID=UPI00135634E4|nr:pilin [Halomonas massiliensis]
MSAHQRGFSFVELMIVVLIVSLLVIQAMRAYRDFPAQAQVLEGVTLTRTIKIDLAEFVANNGRLPSERELNAMQSQLDGISGSFLERIEAGDTLDDPPRSTFRLYFKDSPDVDPQLRDGVMVMVARLPEGGGQIEWACQEASDLQESEGVAIEAHLLRPACRTVVGE